MRRFDSFSAASAAAIVLLMLKRRINTEEKANVVAAVWGTEFVQFLAAQAILHYRTISKNRMNSSFSSNYPGATQKNIFLIYCKGDENSRILSFFFKS